MEKYPLEALQHNELTFRLDETLLIKINRVSGVQKRSHSKVIRDALEMYPSSPEASKKVNKHENTH